MHDQQTRLNAHIILQRTTPNHHDYTYRFQTDNPGQRALFKHPCMVQGERAKRC